jgi:hypothetical protein
MKERFLRLCSVLIILFLAINAAACVAPASTGGTSGSKSGSGSGSGSGASGADTTPTPEYVKEVTPYGWTPPKTAAPLETTIVPTEEWITIYATDQNFTINRTMAVAYELRNPPMVINLTITPVNVTKYVEEWEHYGTKSMSKKNTSVSVYHPSSYFAVIVRDRNSGSIILDDGYSASNNEGRFYPIDTTRTLKVYTTGDFLIEMNGKWIKNANVTIDVKKAGNIENASSS